jgi:SNF2 family DNA or RNA helicase
MIYEKLYPYQVKLVNELKPYYGAGLFSDVGTGKSYMSLSIFEHKMLKKDVNKLVIICLKGKIEEWERDCAKFFPFHKILTLMGTLRKPTEKRFKEKDYDILIVNFEKVWRMPNILKHITPNTMLLIDESHKIKCPNTAQTEFIVQMSFLTPHKLILTATPMGLGYIDLYSQLRFLGLLNMSYKEFENEFVINRLVKMPGIRPFYELAGYKNTEVIDKIVSEYCRYYERQRTDDELPSEIKVDIQLDKLYNKISKDRIYENIVLSKVSQKRIALKALCSGTIIGTDLFDKKFEYTLNTNKIDWVETFLETFNHRVVIFYNFDFERDQLYEMIKKTKRTVARYCGAFKEKDKFIKKDDCVMLVQYKAGSTGIDWLKESYVGVFYSLPDSYIEFYQSKGRIERAGQTKKP